MGLNGTWERLCQVRSLSFVAKSGNPTGWNGIGSGAVVVASVGSGVITFTESGTWRPDGGRDIRFSNVFRWTKNGDTLRLEHLRFGVGNPVYLFDLAEAVREWLSVSPHVCSEDCYTARMTVDEGSIVLRWSVKGSRKQEDIE